MDLLVSAISGAGIVLFCESEYACLRLFKQKNLFSFVCQLAILATALMTTLSVSVYFLHNLLVLPMLIIISIVIFTVNVSYPIMILLRLRLVQNFSIYIMCIPIILTTILTVLRYFWTCSILTGKEYCFHIYFIIQIITTIILTVEYIAINLFFIVIATKHLQNIIHIRCVIIVNIIVIILECAILIIEFVMINKWIILCIVSISNQIKVRMEIEILSFIKKLIEIENRRLMNNEH